MKIREVMSSPVHSMKPDDSIFEAARFMAAGDIGALPIVDDDEVVGMLTDRDIVVRAVASGRDLDDEIATVMSHEVVTCRVDEELDDVLQRMADLQVRRLPVCDEAGAPVGIVTVGDIARMDQDGDEVAEALSEICEPSVQHVRIS